MRFKPWLSLAVLIMLAGAMIVPLRATAAARSPEEVPPTQPPFKARLFPETGHTAVNSFLSFWERTPNALFVLGYPISAPFIEESFTNPGEYYRVQYFERAVLEEHPENYGTPYYTISWDACWGRKSSRGVRMNRRSSRFPIRATARGTA